MKKIHTELVAAIHSGKYNVDMMLYLLRKPLAKHLGILSLKGQNMGYARKRIEEFEIDFSKGREEFPRKEQKALDELVKLLLAEKKEPVIHGPLGDWDLEKGQMNEKDTERKEL